MKKLWVGLLLAALLLGFLLWQNTAVQVTKFKIQSKQLPAAFDGYKIMQLSDLHNADFGDSLTKKIQAAAPDIIVVTGDLIDSRRTDVAAALAVLQPLLLLAPIYYVPGNHEARSPAYPALLTELQAAGVTILTNQKLLLSRDVATIELLGLQDLTSFEGGSQEAQLAEQLMQLSQGSINFQILLAHHPEIFAVYAASSVDLVFSGHAHGGQVRLPVIGGLFAPDQGFLPKYTAGVHQKQGTSMVVSRGLGNSLFPLRVFNPPELIEVTLLAE